MQLPLATSKNVSSGRISRARGPTRTQNLFQHDGFYDWTRDIAGIDGVRSSCDSLVTTSHPRRPPRSNTPALICMNAGIDNGDRTSCADLKSAVSVVHPNPS